MSKEAPIDRDELLAALEMGEGALMLVVKNAAELLAEHPIRAALYCKEASDAAAVLKRHRQILSRHHHQ